MAAEMDGEIMRYEPAPSTARIVLKTELDAFERLRSDLESKYTDQWVVIRGPDLVGVYSEFGDAASDAGNRFGRGPYLIRQVAPTNWLEHAKRDWQARANG